MNLRAHQALLRIILFMGIFSYVIGAAPPPTHALTANEIQIQINNHNTNISSLQNEVNQYQKELDTLGTKRSTLESTIQSLAISREKLTATLAITQNKISTTALTLERLARAIGDKQNTIDAQYSAIASALRVINQTDSLPPFTSILGIGRLTDAWVEADQIDQLNRALGIHVQELTIAKIKLKSANTTIISTRDKLLSLKNKEASQRTSIEVSRNAQEKLLTQTRNKESAYQKLIADKKSSEKQFEQELHNLQSQLNFIVHPSSIPKAGIGILSWPFSSTLMHQCAERTKVFGNKYCITQYFGNTKFSTANPQIYSGHGHNGIDIGVIIGTPVRAALSGTVLATGNTDLSHSSTGKQCYSYGKWVMLVHANGLNTMYAHLSKIDASKGQRVTTGKIIGYSGMTGDATGPHLHFGVYASEGVKIMTLGHFRGISGTRCANASMPIAITNAYLNPLSYLIKNK